VHRAAKLGLGTAYIQGFNWALEQGADTVIQMDADFFPRAGGYHAHVSGDR